MPEIISRKEAKALGLKRYFTGKPCKHGHVMERVVSHQHCIQCARISGAAYLRRYPEKNREKVRRQRLLMDKAKRRETRKKYSKTESDYKRAYRARNAEKISNHQREYQTKNKEVIRLKAKLKRQLHNEEMRRAERERYWSNPANRERNLRKYYEGPSNPKDEMQWLRKNRVQLRSVKRYLKNRRREQSQSSQAET